MIIALTVLSLVVVGSLCFGVDNYLAIRNFESAQLAEKKEAKMKRIATQETSMLRVLVRPTKSKEEMKTKLQDLVSLDEVSIFNQDQWEINLRLRTEVRRQRMQLFESIKKLNRGAK